MLARGEPGHRLGMLCRDASGQGLGRVRSLASRRGGEEPPVEAESNVDFEPDDGSLRHGRFRAQRLSTITAMSKPNTTIDLMKRPWSIRLMMDFVVSFAKSQC